ncbi:MAG: hypothetical protein IJJ71_06055 [Treponema sp.]|uniref:hypothetical protein n=1 Tax=Treponema sp. TaxID=166 RepID=UPI0025D1ABF3|nr:hypothetical protein [Treponema sp.]MBQ9624203.1 hypothetical protein [Treponema sp.]MBR0495717.1 hypothetical protein [Treponema sp.]
MKRYNSRIKILFSALLAVTAASIFSACDGVVFHDIRKEVKLEKAKISGDIHNIVRLKYNGVEHVFASNGTIYYRSVNADTNLGTVTIDSKIDWNDDLPNPDDHVFSLAADTKYLYAATIEIVKDDDGYNVPKSRSLWCFDPDSKAWKIIYTSNYSSVTTFILFCTNTPKPENRKAYFRYGTTVWELSGTTVLTADNKMDAKEKLASGETLASFDNTTTPTYATKSCAFFKDAVYFSSSDAMTTNETSNKDATYIYRSLADNIIYSTDATSWTMVNLNHKSILSIALTANYLLAGTTGGIIHTPLKADSNKIVAIPAAGHVDFSTNADAALSSYYDVQAILVVNPSNDETAATIFATAETSSTSASLNNVGLWSYFSSRNEWNRE